MVAEALKTSGTVTLDLTDNDIGPEGAQAPVGALRLGYEVLTTSQILVREFLCCAKAPKDPD